jgi:hypothetical protein
LEDINASYNQTTKQPYKKEIQQNNKRKQKNGKEWKRMEKKGKQNKTKQNKKLCPGVEPGYECFGGIGLIRSANRAYDFLLFSSLSSVSPIHLFYLFLGQFFTHTTNIFISLQNTPFQLSYNKFMHEQIHFTTCSHT